MQPGGHNKAARVGECSPHRETPYFLSFSPPNIKDSFAALSTGYTKEARVCGIAQIVITIEC